MKHGKPTGSRIRVRRNRYSLERQLRSAQRLAVIGRMATMAGHELSNYLSIVIGNAALLKDSFARGQPDERLLDALILGSKKGALICGQFRNLAHPPAADLRCLDMAESIKETFAMMQRMTRCEIALEETADGPLPVRADGVWLDQILVNLVLNAVDVTKSDGRVIIRTGRVRSGVRRGWGYFEVVDEGAGIPAGIRRRVRELFFTTKPGGRGTGIGLALVCELIAKLGGALLIRSRKGIGATFRVVLPPSPAGRRIPMPGLKEERMKGKSPSVELITAH